MKQGLLFLYLLAVLRVGGEPIRQADREEVKALVISYVSYYTFLHMEREEPGNDFAGLFGSDTVCMVNDFSYFRYGFSRPSAYYNAAKAILIGDGAISNCRIVLSQTKEYLFARVGSDYYVWLYKSIEYTHARLGVRRFASWERLQIRWLPGKGFRIVGIRKEGRPVDADRDGIPDDYETPRSYYPAPVYPSQVAMRRLTPMQTVYTRPRVYYYVRPVWMPPGRVIYRRAYRRW